MLRRHILIVFWALPIFAQAPEISGSSSGPFSGLTKNYRPPPVPALSFDDSPRLEKLMRAGQTYLSVHDAIALALENNLDLEYARFNSRLSDANLLRAKAGQLLRNVTSTVNQGPTSAQLGVLAGANQLGSTGAANSSRPGGGRSGLNVHLAGSAIPNLDPVLTGFWQFSHTTSPQPSSFVTVTNALISQFQNAIFNVQKGYLTGITVQFGMTNTVGLHQNSPNNDFNPST